MTTNLLTKALRVFTGIAALLAAGVVAASPQPAAADVYTEPGIHNVNGRQWRTTCSMYSTTVERCTTDIIATKVSWNGSRWVQSSDWVFNNLTYKPSPRSTWKGNPLATPGYHEINGRKWYTECDTSWTGGNACRSMIEATLPERRGNTYVMVKKYIFNNIVHFTQAKPPAPAPKPKPQPAWFNLTAKNYVGKEGGGGLWGGAKTIGTTYFAEALYGDKSFWDNRLQTTTMEVRYALNGRCSAFEATIGANTDSRYSATPTYYRVYVNDQLKGEYTVEPFQSRKISVDVTGGSQLKLWMHRGKEGGWNTWGKPQVKCTSDPTLG